MQTNPMKIISGRAQMTFYIWLTATPDQAKEGYNLFLKLTSTDDGLLGLLIKDEDGQPFLFNSPDEAYNAGHKFFMKNLICEE